jgi:hypothetical protein
VPHVSASRTTRKPRARIALAALAVAALAGTAATAAVGSRGSAALTGPDNWSMRFQQDWPSFDPYVDAGRQQSPRRRTTA